MNLTNLFENTTPSNNYCDQLAEKLPAGLKSDDDILDAAWDIVVKDLGRTVARNKFMDEDFPSDLIGAYNHMHKQGVEEGGPYDLPGIDYPRSGDIPAKPRHRGTSSPGVNPDDEAYFREIFRKKREAAAKAAQDKEQGMAEGDLNELAPASNPSGGNYLKALASAWYNGTFNTGDLHKGIKSQEDVERILERGIHCGDGKVRKYIIGYNAAFDGVEIQSHDHYEHADYDDAGRDIDSRTGKPWGPYDVVEFHDRDLDESVAEGARERLSNKHDKIRKQAGLPDPKEYEKIIQQKKKEIADLKAQKQQGMSEELSMQHQRDLRTQKFPDTSNSLAKRTVSLAAVPNVTKSADGHPTVRGRADSTQRTAQTRVEPTITPTSVKRLGGDRPIPSFLQKGVAEADKKKEDDLGSEVRDVSLQRAITRAKSDFPTAGSGIEALAKDLMRGQEQDQQDFEKIRAVDKDQERMLAQIAQVDQNQTQEIDNLEQDNTTLKRRLQQIQAVNARLEKTLASMSGRKKEKTTPADTSSSTFSPSAGIPDAPATATSQPRIKSKTKAKAQPAKSSMKSTAAQLAAPKADPMSAMTQRITKGDSSITDKVSGQQALSFEPSDKVLEPVIPQAQQNPKFAAAKTNASDADPRYYKDLTAKIARDVATNPAKAGEYAPAYEGKSESNKPESPEADYGDEYQSMVKRVGQKSAQGPRKTVWDPVKRVYKTVPVNK